MKKSTFTRLFTLTLAALMLLTACGKSPEVTTPEDEYAGLYQPNYLKWPTDMPNVLTAVVSGNSTYAIVGRDEGYSIERVSLPDCTMTTLVTVQAEEAEGDIFTSRSIAALCPVPGGLWYGSYTSTQDNSDSNLIETTARCELVHVDDSGTELVRLDVTETIGNNNLESIAADNDGNVAIIVGDKKYHAFDKSGQHLLSGDFTDFARLVRSSDGSVYLRERINGASFTHTIAPVDFEGKKLGDTLDITKHNAIWINSGYGDDDFYLVTSNGIYALSLEEDTARSVLNFSRHGIGTGEILLVSSDEKGDFYGLEMSRGTSEHPYSPICLQSLENMDIDPENIDESLSVVAGKIELVYGAMFVSMELKNMIADFNKNNSQYSISYVEYYDGDYQAMLDRIALDFSTGNAPDIFDLSLLSVPREKWSTVALDLYPFLDADPEYSRSTFIPSVLAAFEYDGALPMFSPEVSIETLVGKKSIFGDEMGWSFDDMRNIQDLLTDGTMLMGDLDSSWLFSIVFSMGYGQFINEAGTECYFDSQEFIDLLNWCNSLPQNPRYAPGDGSTYDSLLEMLSLLDDDLRSDKVLMTQVEIGSPRAIRQFQEAFGEEVNFIGYPGNGYGAGFQTALSFSISTTCQHPEAAWEFIRSTLSPDYNCFFGFPAVAAKLEALLNLEMTPLDRRIQSNYNTSASRYLYNWSFDIDVSEDSVAEGTPEYDNYHLTQAEVDQFMDIVNATTTEVYYDLDITAIIDDAVAPFFAGGKSAEETAKEIQSRVSILLAERS